jgi:hypothetical protein
MKCCYMVDISDAAGRSLYNITKKATLEKTWER